MQAHSHGAVTSPDTNGPAPVTIAIVGAGFSGTVLAINLMRRLQKAPLDIMLIDLRTELGSGVAYAPRDFLDYRCDQGIHADPGDYLPRAEQARNSTPCS